MSTARQEEIIRKGFIKSLLEGKLELKDLAGINIDLEIARQAYLQGVQEATQDLIEYVKENMASSAKQDLQASAAGQALAKAVLDSILTGIASVYADMATGAGQALQATASKQDLLKGVMDESKELLTNLYENLYPVENLIDDCESVAGWDKGNYDTLAVDADKKEGTYSLKMVKVNAVASTWYIVTKSTFDPPLDFSRTKIIKIWTKVVEAGYELFTVSRIYLYDTSNRYAYWNLKYDADTWTLQELDIETPTGRSEGLDLSNIDEIRWQIKPYGGWSGDLTAYMDHWRRAESTDKLLKSKMDEIFNDMATGDKQDLQATAAGQAAILDAINEEAYVEESDNNLYAETRSDVVISTTYIATILKVRILIAGTYRVQWEMKQYADQVRGYFMVYKNGVAHGAAKSGASPFDEWSQVSDDLYFIAGDVLCIYGKEIDAHQIMCRNLQLDGDISEGVAYQE